MGLTHTKGFGRSNGGEGLTYRETITWQRSASKPNKSPQQAGHADNACERRKVSLRVSRLLSWVFGCDTKSPLSLS
jgi:hypothetical protein